MLSHNTPDEHPKSATEYCIEDGLNLVLTYIKGPYLARVSGVSYSTISKIRNGYDRTPGKPYVCTEQIIDKLNAAIRSIAIDLADVHATEENVMDLVLTYMPTIKFEPILVSSCGKSKSWFKHRSSKLSPQYAHFSADDVDTMNRVFRIMSDMLFHVHILYVRAHT